MVKHLNRITQEWQRFVTLVKQSQELKAVSHHKFYDILKQHHKKVNEIRAKKLARTANPLALVAQQQPDYHPLNHPQKHPTHYTQNSSTRPQQAITRNRGKAIVNSPQPTYDQEPTMVADDDEIGTGYDNQRAVNVAGARENVGDTNITIDSLDMSNNRGEADQDNDDDLSRERVNPPTSVSRPQLKSNQIEDRVMLNNSQRKKQEVEYHRRNVKFSNNKMSITAC
nr:hypothetical protein [Tanacetum cinerariifolium]